MNEPVRKILVVELWGIGDVVMMSAVLKPLREKFPVAEICILAQEHGRQVLLHDKDVSRVFVYKFPWTAFQRKYCLWRWDGKGLLAMVRTLRREKFDLVLDARGDPRNDVLSWLIAPRRYVRRPGGPRAGRHRLDDWGRLLNMLDARDAGLQPHLVIGQEESAQAREFIGDKFPRRAGKLVGIHPGAAQPVRRWSLARFEALASRLRQHAGADVLMLVDPDGCGEDAALRLGIPYLKGSLRALMAVVAQLDLLVCNDTGVMHMAHGLGVPLVAVFGPGDPSFIGPRDHGAVVIRPCAHRPCFDRCRQAVKMDCLDAVSLDDVWRVVEKKV